MEEDAGLARGGVLALGENNYLTGETKVALNFGPEVGANGNRNDIMLQGDGFDTTLVPAISTST